MWTKTTTQNLLLGLFVLANVNVAAAEDTLNFTKSEPKNSETSLPEKKEVFWFKNATGNGGRYIVRHRLCTGTISSVVFPSSKVLASAQYAAQAEIVFWNVSTGDRIRTIQLDMTKAGLPRISGDGKDVAVGAEDVIALFDSQSGDIKWKNPLTNIAGHENGVVSVVFSQDGQLVCTGGMSTERTAPTVCLFDRKSGKIVDVLETQTLPRKGVDFLAVSSDCRRVAACTSNTSETYIWEKRGDRFRKIQKYNGNGPMSFSPDGRLFVFANIGDLYFLNAKTWANIGSVKNPGMEMISDLTFSPDGQFVACTNSAGVGLWSVNEKKRVLQFEHRAGSVYSLGFTDCGKFLAAGNLNGSVVVYDLKSLVKKEAK